MQIASLVDEFNHAPVGQYSQQQSTDAAKANGISKQQTTVAVHSIPHVDIPEDWICSPSNNQLQAVPAKTKEVTEWNVSNPWGAEGVF